MAKIIAITLTLAGRGSDLKLEMLEAIDTIATDGKLYIWGYYVSNMIKTICEYAKRWKESSVKIKPLKE